MCICAWICIEGSGDAKEFAGDETYPGSPLFVSILRTGLVYLLVFISLKSILSRIKSWDKNYFIFALILLHTSTLERPFRTRLRLRLPRARKPFLPILSRLAFQRGGSRLSA